MTDYACRACEHYFQSSVPQCPKCQSNKMVVEFGQRTTPIQKADARAAASWFRGPGLALTILLLLPISFVRLPLVAELGWAFVAFAVGRGANVLWHRMRATD